jgi:hypothetical protein
LRHWQRSELLYLSPDASRRVYVQIDCVQGACPAPAELGAMEAFLHRHVRLAEGVVFDHSPPIGPADVAGRDETQLALSRMKLPPRYDDGQTAYIYVLFYDSSLAGQDKPHRPYVRVDYPCAVFVDMAYWKPRNRPILAAALQHEMAHVLGLTKNEDHGDGSHCNDPDCLAHPVLRIPKPGQRPRQQSLCANCLADLQRSRRRRAPAELSFHGPVLVRRAKGYRVASMPGFTRVILDAGEPESSCRQVALEARQFAATRTGLADKCHCSLDAPELALDDESQKRKMLWALVEASSDPDASIAGLARKLYNRLMRSQNRLSGLGL